MTAIKLATTALLLALLLGACSAALPEAAGGAGGTPGTAGPTTPVKPSAPVESQSCPDWTLSRGGAVEAATFSDTFYWGRDRLGTAFCGDDSPNRSVAGRLESVAGGKANATTLLKVMEGRTIVRVWLVIHLDSGRSCTGSLDGSGNATCVMEVTPNDDGSFTIDDLPVVEDEPPASDDPQPEVDPYYNPDVQFSVSVSGRSGCFGNACSLSVSWRWTDRDGETTMPEGATLVAPFSVGSIPGFEFQPTIIDNDNFCHWSGTISKPGQPTVAATASGCDVSEAEKHGAENLGKVWEGYWQRMVTFDGKQRYFGYCVGNSCRYENRH